MGKDDGRMDPLKLTEHTGCPIVAGEKWITTFWMRKGVNQTSPFGNFATTGEMEMDTSQLPKPLIYPNATTAFQTKIDCCRGSLYKSMKNMIELYVPYSIRESLAQYSYLSWLSNRYEIPDICEFDLNSYCNISSPTWWTEVLFHITENIVGDKQTKKWKDYTYTKYPHLIPPVFQKFYEPEPEKPKYDQCGNVISGPGYVHPSITEFMQAIEHDSRRVVEQENYDNAIGYDNNANNNNNMNGHMNDENYYMESETYQSETEELTDYDEELFRKMEQPSSPPPVQRNLKTAETDLNHQHDGSYAHGLNNVDARVGDIIISAEGESLYDL